MSPFADLPSLPGCGRCECGAPVAYRVDGADVCYASGTYTFLRSAAAQQALRFPSKGASPAYAAAVRGHVFLARRAYWQALAGATFREEVAA